MKWVESRREDFQASGHDREQSHQVKIGFRKDGAIAGIDASFLADVGAYPAQGNGLTLKYERAKYDGYMFGWGITTGEPDQALGDHFHSAAPKRTMYRNPEVDRYIAEERESFDDVKVKTALLKAQELIWDGAPWIFLYENPEVNAINRKLQWEGGRRDEYPIFTGASLQA